MESKIERKMPKSYLTDEEREDMRIHGTEGAVLALEAQTATEHNDYDTALEWLSMAELPTSVLKTFKKSFGADFLIEKGFNTINADKELGKDWLLK